MKLNFWIVLMMIGTPEFRALASWAESESIFWTTPCLLLELIDRLLKLLIGARGRSVMTITEEKMG